MKVLHISTSDRQGGAAIAAYRLNEAYNLYHVNHTGTLSINFFHFIFHIFSSLFGVLPTMSPIRFLSGSI